MVVLEKIPNIFICNNVKVCIALDLVQQLLHAIENRHF